MENVLQNGETKGVWDSRQLQVNFMAQVKKHIFITGPPGIGKSTIIKRLYDMIKEKQSVAGFYTGEFRKNSIRQGFQVSTFQSGQTAILAHVEPQNDKFKERVGKYFVNVDGFEKTVLPELDLKADLLLIDEIGKMECFSNPFIKKMKEILNRDSPIIIGTVAEKGSGLIQFVKQLPQVEIVHVSLSNRDLIPTELFERLSSNAN